jgi:transcriptional regulator with XRE-family HTH domain
MRQQDPILAALQRRRQELKLSRRKLAQRSGYADNQIYCWESGRAAPSLPKLHDWAASLGLELLVREASGHE